VILQYSFEGSVRHITIRWWYKKAFPLRLESCGNNFPDIPDRAFFPVIPVGMAGIFYY